MNWIKSLFGLRPPRNESDRAIQTAREELSEWKHEIRPLTQHELDWLSGRRSMAMTLIQKYSPTFDGSNSELLRALDSTFKAWMNDQSAERTAVTDIVDGLGALYAEMFIQMHGFQWVWVTFEQGADFAVHQSTTQHFVFPMGVIQKRVEKSEWGFFENIFLVTQAEVLAKSDSR
jgi:Domain of unknown function (DUF3806)